MTQDTAALVTQDTAVLVTQDTAALATQDTAVLVTKDTVALVNLTSTTTSPLDLPNVYLVTPVTLYISANKTI